MTQKRWWLLASVLTLAFGINFSRAEDQPAERQILLDVLVAELHSPTALPGSKPAPADGREKKRGPYTIRLLSPQEQKQALEGLRSLQTQDKCSVLTRPQVLTQDGQSARVMVGGSGSRPVVLSFRPVLKNDAVHLELDAKVGNAVEQAVASDAGLLQLCASLQHIQLDAVVQEGKTLLVSAPREENPAGEAKPAGSSRRTLLLLVKPTVYPVHPVEVPPHTLCLDGPDPRPRLSRNRPLPPPPIPTPDRPAWTPKPPPPVAPAPPAGWRVRVITEEGEARLEIQGGNTCLTCPQVTFKQPDGSQLRLSVSGKQIQIEAAQFRATADCLTKKENGQFLLEGNVRAQLQGAGTGGGVEVMGNQVTIGTKDMHQQPLGCQ